MAVVWSVQEQRAPNLLSLDNTAFEASLEAASHHALGKLTLASERAAWPLQLAQADRWCGPGWVLAGDAAHVNNPLGGLGLNFGIHDAMELAELLGRVLREEADSAILDLYDRFRRPLNVEYVQQQTIANKKRLEEKNPDLRMKNHQALREMAADPVAHRAFLLRASLIDAVRKRQTAAS